MEFPPAGLAWFSPILYLGLVLVESRADEEAAQLVGRTLLQLETVPAGQWTALVLRSAVSLAMWRGDLTDAHNAAEQDWRRVSRRTIAAQIVVAAATVLEACAAAADDGRLTARLVGRGRGHDAGQRRVMPVAEQACPASQLPAHVGARREAELHMATARAHHERVRGRTKRRRMRRSRRGVGQDPGAVPGGQGALVAGSGGTCQRARAAASARRALTEAWRIARKLPAAPLRARCATWPRAAASRCPPKPTWSRSPSNRSLRRPAGQPIAAPCRSSRR